MLRPSRRLRKEHPEIHPLPGDLHVEEVLDVGAHDVDHVVEAVELHVLQVRERGLKKQRNGVSTSG